MSAVENITDSMASATIQDHANDASAGTNNVISGQPVNTAQNEAVIASAAEGRRLYIGNLAYATTEGDLQKFFEGYLM